MTQYQPGPVSQPANPPGKTLGIVGLVLSILCGLVGAIVSFIAYRQSQAAGWKNNVALAGIIIGVVFFALGLIARFTGMTAGLFGR
jgi:FtsH-binding integral membrane protein